MLDLDTTSECLPLADLLIRAACRRPDHPSLVFPAFSRSYAQLLSGAVTIARGLTAAGIEAGEHVGLLALNGLEFVEAFFGIALAGCVVVPLHPRHRATELGYIVRNADLAALLTTSDSTGYVDLSEVVAKALPSLERAPTVLNLRPDEAPRLRAVMLLDGGCRPGFVVRDELDRLSAASDDEAIERRRQAVRVRDPALILYTSGTTSHPKGCVLTHEAIVRGPVYRARRRLGTAESTVTWGAGPLSHIGSLSPFIGTFGVMGTYVTDVFFEPGRAIELGVRAGVSAAWPWFPAIIQGILDHPSFHPAVWPNLRTLMLIASPALVRKVQATFPRAEILQACGMTETAGIFALSALGESAEERATTHGRAVPGVGIRIVDVRTGADLPSGRIGELLVRGYCLTEGYYRDPEKSAAAIDADGWLRTGDLYQLTSEGSLVFSGRLKDMLKVGGENVAAVEIESVLCEHAAVRAAEVVGHADPRLDEVPVAFIELQPAATATAEDLIAFCRDRIASFKVPRAIHFVAAGEWPMSATKVDKRALRERLAALQAKCP